jgi:hypothetical protein
MCFGKGKKKVGGAEAEQHSCGKLTEGRKD